MLRNVHFLLLYPDKTEVLALGTSNVPDPDTVSVLSSLKTYLFIKKFFVFVMDAENYI